MTVLGIPPYAALRLWRRRQTFVVPDLAGPVSGGTLFNRMLMGALVSLGWSCTAVTNAKAEATVARLGPEDDLWIDTLFLDHFAALSAHTGAGARVGLLTHYLPSLVRHGDSLRAEQLSDAEALALREARMFLVPSAFMRTTVERLSERGHRPVLCVEPGRLAEKGEVIGGPPVRAALVANLVPGKGVEPFLASVAERIHDRDDFHLSIVGSATFDGDYAARCIRLGQDGRLRGRVRFVGALSPLETVRLMADCNVIVSASTMEAYGMAIAEARTLGLPLLARAGGNVANLVDPSVGGEVVSSADALAEAFLALCRNQCEQARRLDVARAHALPRRSWKDAALDFESQMLASLPEPFTGGAGDGGREGVHED